MFCDDHAVVRQGYVSLLEAVLSGSEMFEAACGQEAFVVWQQQRPDLLVLDVHLPDISGLELARRILQRDRQARILMFSMYDELALVNQALQLGVLVV